MLKVPHGRAFFQTFFESLCTAVVKPNISSTAKTFRLAKCGKLSINHLNDAVKIRGWLIHSRYDHKFLVVKDETGTVQVLLDNFCTQIFADESVLDFKDLEMPLQSVIEVEGLISKRPTENPKMPTGKIEILAQTLKLINKNYMSETQSMFMDNHDNNYTEYEKLRYRYAYLRTNFMQNNLRKRAKFLSSVRNFLDAENFVEIETPYLHKPSPPNMGASEFLVKSSRKFTDDAIDKLESNQSSYYALCQSPQILKQALMASGFDRYYQIARCFRNETRISSERQPEFTQIDLEASFATPNDIMQLIERMLVHSWPTLFDTDDPQNIQAPFPTMTYDEAMRLYGSDKPDLRYRNVLQLQYYPNEKFDNDNLKQTNMVGLQINRIIFRNIEKLLIENQGNDSTLFNDLLRKIFISDDIHTVNVDKKKSQSIIYCFNQNNETTSLIPIISYDHVQRTLDFNPNYIDINQINSIQLCFNSSYSLMNAQIAMGRLRNLLLSYCFSQQELQTLRSSNTTKDFEFVWITHFPMFELKNHNINNNGASSIGSVHHPFTAVIPEHKSALNKIFHSIKEDNFNTMMKDDQLVEQILALRAQHYDLVVNGVEIGGGSVRIHNRTEQTAVFSILFGDGRSNSQKSPQNNLGYFLEILSAGCPPHAGIALGCDRIVALARGCQTIQDVIAFPKSASGRDVLSDCPCPI